MLRLGFLYSFVMSLAGSSLLAEIPEPPQVEPTQGTELQMAYAEPTEFKEDTSTPQPAPVLTSTQHLKAAIAHLREAGFEADAERIQRQADELVEVRMTKLQAQRKELEQLQCEISQLEQELGIDSQYQLTSLMAEVSLKTLEELDLIVEAKSASGEVEQISGKELFQTNRSLPAPVFQSIIEALQRQNALQVIAEPTLIVGSGQSAAFFSGGEFPVPVPGADEEHHTTSRTYGVMLVAKVTPLGENRVRLTATPEHSERDFSNSIKQAGLVIPGIKMQRVSAGADMQLGETLILGAVTRSENDEKKIWFTAITPRKIESPAPIPIPREAKLQPIPDEGLIR